jgi:hypothetical protein
MEKNIVCLILKDEIFTPNHFELMISLVILNFILLLPIYENNLS